MKNKVICLVLLISLMLAAAGCRRGETANGYEKVEKSEFLMGTLVTIKIFDRDEEKASRAAEEALERIREIEALLSVSKKESEINRINQRAGVQPVSVSDDTINVVDRGIYYGGLSDGLFDVTVGPLVSLWGIGTERQEVPGDEELNKALALIDYRDVEINREAGEVYLKRPGMGLDLGGIAKGYAADEVKELLEAAGIKHAVINLGGNILTVGAKYDGGPWNIGIKDPEEPAGSLLGMARIIGKTVVTSGDYERYFEEDGRRYHHILNPFTGYPGKSEIRGVTIITSSSIDADALSTTVFLLGPEEGMQLIESLEGVEAVVVTDKRQVVLSSGIKDTFSLLKANYKIRQVGAK